MCLDIFSLYLGGQNQRFNLPVGTNINWHVPKTIFLQSCVTISNVQPKGFCLCCCLVCYSTKMRMLNHKFFLK
jgi:hypothetical protein